MTPQDLLDVLYDEPSTRKALAKLYDAVDEHAWRDARTQAMIYEQECKIDALFSAVGDVNDAGPTPHGISWLEELLEKADTDRLSTTLIVGFLSIFMLVSPKLSTWKGFVRRAEASVRAQRPDHADAILKGLIDDDPRST